MTTEYAVTILQNMKTSGYLLGLLAGLLATGCGTKTATLPIVATPLPTLTGNWQIQSAASTPPSTVGAVLLLGALQSTGSQVSGTFRFSNLTQGVLGGCALNQVVTVTGTVDAAGDLALTSAALPDGTTVTVQLVVPPVPTNFASGTIAVSGKTCAVASAPAIGVETASLSGTFTGLLMPLAVISPAGPAGSTTLTLTQTSTPAADGQFPATGTLAYTFGSCTGTVALTGTVSGAGLTLTAVPPSPQLLSGMSLTGLVPPSANQVTISELLFAPFACAANPPETAAYTGVLTKQ